MEQHHSNTQTDMKVQESQVLQTEFNENEEEELLNEPVSS